MNKSFAHICLIVSFLGMTMAFTDSAIGQERALASGPFNCNVIVIDPPNGETWGYANMYFDAILGIIGGPVDTGTSIGTGSGLDAICEELTTTIHTLAQNQTCTVSAIQKRHNVFSNGMEDTWSFNVLCNSRQTNVIDAVSNILEGILITPLVASHTTQVKSNEMR